MGTALWCLCPILAGLSNSLFSFSIEKKDLLLGFNLIARLNSHSSYGRLFETTIVKITIMKSPAVLKCRLALTSLFLFSLNMLAIAQDQVVIDKQEVGSWFARNWIWVTTGVFVLLIIIVLSSGTRERRKTTTVVKDDLGNVKRVTTTEEHS